MDMGSWYCRGRQLESKVFEGLRVLVLLQKGQSI